MKKAILLAALLSVGAASPALAQTSPSAGNAQSILNTTAGNLNLNVSGTTQFNNSIGTNQSFNVGSSTNLGVNSSVSSTSDYNGSSNSMLNLAGTSTLQQTI
ncbi:MAG: hypothetical protein NTY40_09070, partial [Synechococcus sp. LacPavin_0920_WC12_MAG_50_7]|nr:hypothetical protein [Synechococcus sp. LacPavin_0920_WC12_MAG_50_7]